MKIFKDFFRRKAIAAKAVKVVNNHFTEAELKKLKVYDKKAMVRLEKLIKQMNLEVYEYFDEVDLGIYGQAKFIRQAQERIKDFKLPPKLLDYVINKMILI